MSRQWKETPSDQTEERDSFCPDRGKRLFLIRQRRDSSWLDRGKRLFLTTQRRDSRQNGETPSVQTDQSFCPDRIEKLLWNNLRRLFQDKDSLFCIDCHTYYSKSDFLRPDGILDREYSSALL
jgi:hypothetical protein